MKEPVITDPVLDEIAQHFKLSVCYMNVIAVFNGKIADLMA